MTLSDYNKCVDLYADGVYRFILKQVKDQDASKDIVQDAFEKMWRKLEDIDASKSKTYLFTTAYHNMVDHFRKQNKQSKFEEVNFDQHFHDKQYSDLKEVLNRSIDLLPEIQKTVLLLRDYEGYDYAEIGEITKLNESQVKVYIFRARTFLKNHLVNINSLI